MREKVVLIILDGWGYREGDDYNAIEMANPRNIKKYMDKYPTTLLSASGKDVGLPDGTPGFCEYSYFLMGTGQKMTWDHEKIIREIKQGKFEKRVDPILRNPRIHVFVVLTENGIYSHISLLKEFMRIARKRRKRNVFIHLILEGRESGLHSAYDLFTKWKDENITNHLVSIVGGGEVLSRNIPRLAEDYLARLISPEEYFPSFISALMTGYDRGENDYNMTPKVLTKFDILPGDTALILGYRSSKWAPLVSSLLDLGLNVYHLSYPNKENLHVIYKSRIVKTGFLDQLASGKKKILKIGETEKEMALNYFFTGGNMVGDSVIFPSIQTLDYSVTPEMQAPEITGEALKRVKEGKYDFIVVSFANPDVIAHTGNFDSLIAAIKVVDDGVGRIVRASQKEAYVPVIVGDHGNAEEMQKDGKLFLGHTTNPVPFIIASDKYKGARLRKGTLLDVPATIGKIIGKRVSVVGSPLF